MVKHRRAESTTDVTQNSPEAKQFRLALVALRKKKGLRQQDVERLSGVNRNTLAAWEQGRAIWQAVTQIARVAAAIGVTPNELFGVVEQNDPDASEQTRLERIVTVLTRNEKQLAVLTKALEKIGKERAEKASSEQSLVSAGDEEPPLPRRATGASDALKAVTPYNIVSVEVMRRARDARAKASATLEKARRLQEKTEQIRAKHRDSGRV